MVQKFNNLSELERTIYASSGNNPDPISIDFSPGSDHVALQTDLWTVSAWKEDEVQFKGTHIIDQIEKVSRIGKRFIQWQEHSSKTNLL